MSDHLYLSLWFSDFPADEMLPHALRVMRQFPFSAQQPGISYFALHPVSWTEPTILEQRFTPAITSEGAILVASEVLHEDNAYSFEAFWDLWLPAREQAKENGEWEQLPSKVNFIVRGTEFDEGAAEQEGHIQVDFGIDSHFLLEEVPLTEWAEQRVRANIQKLVEFTNNVEKQAGVATRLLWSESEENFAQKLIARLQRVQ